MQNHAVCGNFIVTTIRTCAEAWSSRESTARSAISVSIPSPPPHLQQCCVNTKCIVSFVGVGGVIHCTFKNLSLIFMVINSIESGHKSSSFHRVSSRNKKKQTFCSLPRCRVHAIAVSPIHTNQNGRIKMNYYLITTKNENSTLKRISFRWFCVLSGGVLIALPLIFDLWNNKYINWKFERCFSLLVIFDVSSWVKLWVQWIASILSPSSAYSHFLSHLNSLDARK